MMARKSAQKKTDVARALPFQRLPICKEIE
jgi:hypothetical protein